MSNTVTLNFKADISDMRRGLISLGEGFSNFEGGLALTTVALGAITAAVSAAPALIGAALAAAPLVFAGISVAAILSSKEVKKSFKDMKEGVMSDIRSIAAPMQNEFIHIFARIRDEVGKLKPLLAEGFKASAPLIDVLVTGLFKLSENALPGLLRAVNAAGPTMAAMRDGLAKVGDAISYFFTKMAQNSDIGAKGMAAFFNGLSSVIRGLADLLVWLSTGATAFHAIHDAVVGVLPILLQLFVQLEKALGPAFRALVPLVMDLARTISAILIPIFQAFAGPLGVVAKALAEALHPAFVMIQEAMVRLTPTINLIAKLLGEIFAEAIRIVAPLLINFLDVMIKIVEAVAPFIPQVLQLAKDLLPPLGQALKAVQDGFMQLVPPILDLARQLLPVLIDALGQVVRVFATDLIPVLVQVAKDLFPVLAEVLRQLVPIIVELAKSALPAAVEIFKLLAPVVADLARAVLPILVSIIKDGLIPIIRDVLAPTITALSRDVFPALVTVMRDVLVPILRDIVIPAVRLFGELWKRDILPILTDYVIPCLKVVLPDACRIVGESLHKLVDAFKVELQAIKDFFTKLPNDITGALGDLGKTLFGAGVSLMRGFADGISSMHIPVVSQAADVLKAVDNLFPHSPAKEGPFSGSGYTWFSGQALMRDFAAGVQSIDIQSIFSKILSGVGGMFSAQGSPGGGGTVNASIPGVGALQLKVAPGADSALASLLMNMVRTGQLQLMRA